MAIMIYDSLQAELMENRLCDRIHRYGIPILANIIYMYKPIKNDNHILWR